jgi:hypothetical protein
MRCNRHDAKHYHKCEACGLNDVIKPKRKCAACKSTKGMHVVNLRDGNKGRNARGIASRKPDKSRVKVKPYRISDKPKAITAYKPWGRM